MSEIGALPQDRPKYIAIYNDISRFIAIYSRKPRCRSSWAIFWSHLGTILRLGPSSGNNPKGACQPRAAQSLILGHLSIGAQQRQQPQGGVPAASRARADRSLHPVGA